MRGSLDGWRVRSVTGRERERERASERASEGGREGGRGGREGGRLCVGVLLKDLLLARCPSWMWMAGAVWAARALVPMRPNAHSRSRSRTSRKGLRRARRPASPRTQAVTNHYKLDILGSPHPHSCRMSWPGGGCFVEKRLATTMLGPAMPATRCTRLDKRLHF